MPGLGFLARAGSSPTQQKSKPTLLLLIKVISDEATWSYICDKKKKKKQDVFVKHECPRNGHFLRNVTSIFDLDPCR